MCLKRLFKKKEQPIIEQPKPKKFDFNNCKITLNVKTFCTYEQLTGKSFLSIETEEDVLKLYYAALIVNNDMFSTMTFDVFLLMLNNEAIVKWLAREYVKAGAFMSQFKKNKEDADGDEEEKQEPFKIMEVATALIVKMGIDAHYVMYEMPIWELEHFFSQYESKIHEHYEEQRLWTYLDMMPHIDNKKCKSPQKLMPFPWEEEHRKKKINKDLEDNMYAARNLIGKEMDWIK